MRRIIYILLFFIVSISIVFGDQFHKYNMNELGTIPEGVGNASVFIREGLMNSPIGFGVKNNGHFIIADTLNQRLVEFDENLNFVKNIVNIQHMYNSHIFEDCDPFILGSTNGTTIQLYNNETGIEYYIDFNNHFPSQNRVLRYSSLLINQVVFFYFYENNEISSFIISSLEDSEIQLLNREETRALMESEENNVNGLFIDSLDRLFIDEELITRTYNTFINYYIEVLGGETQMKSLATVESSPYDLSTNTRYIGQDCDGNYYWNDNQAVAVFNRNGFFLDLIVLDRDKKMVIPDIDMEGNIYSLSIDQNEVKIYKIPRQW